MNVPAKDIFPSVSKKGSQDCEQQHADAHDYSPTPAASDGFDTLNPFRTLDVGGRELPSVVLPALESWRDQHLIDFVNPSLVRVSVTRLGRWFRGSLVWEDGQRPRALGFRPGRTCALNEGGCPALPLGGILLSAPPLLNLIEGATHFLQRLGDDRV